MTDIERCDICGQPMGAGDDVCNSTRCYTTLVKAKAAYRGVTVEQVLEQDRALAAGLEIAKAVHPVGLFDEEAGDGKMAELARNGGTVGDTYIPPSERSYSQAEVDALLRAAFPLRRDRVPPAFAAPYGCSVVLEGVERQQYDFAFPPGVKLSSATEDYLQAQVASLTSELARVQHVAEEKARYWEIRCEYAEVEAADTWVALDQLAANHDLGDDGRDVVRNLITRLKVLLADRAERRPRKDPARPPTSPHP